MPRRSLWDDFQGDAAAIGVRASAIISDACVVSFHVYKPEALADAVREANRRAGAASPNDVAARLFTAEMVFLQTQFAARGIRAFYATQAHEIDRCRFEATAYTLDIYGREIAQLLFDFEFDRTTFEKIVWNRFDPLNMPKIMLAFEYGPYASQRLTGNGKGKTDINSDSTSSGE
jgi:hypothetical protein